MSKLKIIKNGLWTNNPALTQLLGLCPLLAVSNTAVNAMTLGLASIVVLVLCNATIAGIKKYINYNIRIPYFMLLIASIVTCLLILLQSYSYDLYKTLGVYLALITTNCVILARIEAYAYKNTIFKAILDGFANGLGFCIVLLILGSLREILGQGTLFAHFDQLFGEPAKNWVINFSHQPYHFILALLPPGAFLTLGFLIALKNYLTCDNNPSIDLSKRTKPKAYELPATLSSIPKIKRT